MARNKPDKPRVFCIGWHKTGTTTMGKALLELGYSVLGCRLDMANPLLRNKLEIVLEEAGKYDALQDVPWAALFKELDKAYPGSKFILTWRDPDRWLKSASNHFKSADVYLHKWLYGNGVLEGNEDIYLQRYKKHNNDVRDYFANRTDYLEMDLSTNDGWDKLCGFIDEPIPQKKFPHANKGRHNYSLSEKTINIFRNITPLALRKFRVKLLQHLGHPVNKDIFNNRKQNRGVHGNR